MSIIARNNIKISGNGDRPILFIHGFGCDQAMWRYVTPHFEDGFRVITIDQVGAGGSDLTAYDPQKYSSLNGYAADIGEIGTELGLRKGILVGHSVSAMIGTLASIAAPEMFDTLVLVAPSPRYIDDGDYEGGFTSGDIEELLEAFDENPLAWSASMGPAIMGNPDRPELGQELAESFCRTDPEIARQFARVTFTSDNRADLPHVTARTLILQCRDDFIAPEAVGIYIHERIPGSELVLLDATGHCPNLSAPDAVVHAIKAFV